MQTPSYNPPHTPVPTTPRREKLSYDCKAALFDQEVLMSENIDFNYPMKMACVKEIDEFCKDVPHGHARVIRCLSDNKDKVCV